ncbi:response regulator [Singulisphaera acidiphila]|uniref:Response regulator containing a CheY-like receiver domain and an HTH DNA-binding domain n=1 Tax=Singulisphaera acidiphila (strain ATCC BAA-1392 / DSM 18658 / VKM B-2454 / MOB10) TaxID=886293 RepID=L0DQ73_SINAD|nr:response regulator transcription factor [Singulisphaera acidiphila]AGA30985.1 response regulator containing a CheY-like receiver domain and an HTH DNA-binding domain [Singulisphaera acidiphila DSM 18658]
MNKNKIRVILADAHALVRAGIRCLLTAMDAIEVVAEASDGDEALIAVEAHRPEVLISDLVMPHHDGLELTEHVAKEYPETKVLILSMYSSEDHVIQALRAGAAGYLLKNSSANELELAVRTVAQGESYLSPPISKHVVTRCLQCATNEAAVSVALTARQREILKRIAEGQSTKEIASSMNISLKTVAAHRAKLMDRLKIYEIASLTRYAIQIGISKVEKSP